MYRKDVEQYFDEISKNYDEKNQKYFWKLTDELLLFLLANNI